MDETKIENQSEPNVSDNTQTQPVYTASKKNTKHVRGISDYVFIVLRALIILLVCSMFFAAFNPAYIFTKANGNSINNISSVFTAALSKSSIVVNDISNAITKGVLDAAPFTKLHVACIIIVLAIIYETSKFIGLYFRQRRESRSRGFRPPPHPTGCRG